jgi:RNA-directed DNA polymerase
LCCGFHERVLHHAVMNVCHQYFDKTLIYDTYATRINKGVYKALDKAAIAMRNYKYVAKLDYRKYFDSISHEMLKNKLLTKFKDVKLLNIFDKIIDSYEVNPDFGLPIGNLTSQYFANFYLSDLDHFIKEEIGIKDYIRYMDDMLLFSNDKAQLECQLHTIYEYSEQMRLTLKPFVLSNTKYGVSFLGYKLFPNAIKLNRNSKKRFFKKMQQYDTYLHDNIFTEKDYQLHIIPLLSFVRHAYTKRLRKISLEGRIAYAPYNRSQPVST